MSTDIASFPSKLGNIQIIQYGSKEGLALQITQDTQDNYNFIQLSYADVYRLLPELTKWLQEISSLKAQQLEQRIAELTLEKESIFTDAVECSRFIQDLKYLEIPVRLLEIIT